MNPYEIFARGSHLRPAVGGFAVNTVEPSSDRVSVQVYRMVSAIERLVSRR